MNTKMFLPFELFDKVKKSKPYSLAKFSGLLILTGIASDFCYQKYQQSADILHKIETKDEEFRRSVVTPAGVNLVNNLV